MKIKYLRLAVALGLSFVSMGNVSCTSSTSGDLTAQEIPPAPIESGKVKLDKDGVLTYSSQQSNNRLNLYETGVDSVVVSSHFIGFIYRDGGGAIYGANGGQIAKDAGISKIQVSEHVAGYLYKSGGGAIFLAKGGTLVESSSIDNIQITDQFAGYTNSGGGGIIYSFLNGSSSQLLADPMMTDLQISKNFYGYLRKGGTGLLRRTSSPYASSLETGILHLYISDNFAGVITQNSKFSLFTASKQILSLVDFRAVDVKKNLAAIITKSFQGQIFNPAGEKVFDHANTIQLSISNAFYGYILGDGSGALLRQNGDAIMNFGSGGGYLKIAVGDAYAGYVSASGSGALYNSDGSFLTGGDGWVDVQATDCCSGYRSAAGYVSLWGKNGHFISSDESSKSLAASDNFIGYVTARGDAYIFDRTGRFLYNNENARSLMFSKNFAVIYLYNDQSLLVLNRDGNLIHSQQNVSSPQVSDNYVAYKMPFADLNSVYVVNRQGSMEGPPGMDGVSSFTLSGDDLYLTYNGGKTIVRNLPSGFNLTSGQ